MNREAQALSEDEEKLFVSCFAPLGFTRAQFTRLLMKGVVERVPEVPSAEFIIIISIISTSIIYMYIPSTQVSRNVL